jgi:hypothetical protein
MTAHKPMRVHARSGGVPGEEPLRKGHGILCMQVTRYASSVDCIVPRQGQLAELAGAFLAIEKSKKGRSFDHITQSRLR